MKCDLRGRGEAQSYLDEFGRAEAGASVEPVIVAKLIDLDAPSIGLLSLMRHCLCHHRLVGVPSVGGDAIVVCEEVGRNVEVLLQREFGGGVGGISEDGKRRHFVGWWARDHECARCRGLGVGVPVVRVRLRAFACALCKVACRVR